MARDSVRVAKDHNWGHHMNGEPSEMTELLIESNAMAEESIKVGYDSILHMGIQKERIKRSHANVENTQGLTERVKLLLGSIEAWSQRRICILYTVMVVLFVTNCALALRLIFHDGSLLR